MPDGITPVPVVLVDVARPLGVYSGRADGSPTRMAISRQAADVGLTFVHEAGHYIDHHVLGGAAGVASGRPLVDNWRNAARATAATQRLMNIVLNPGTRLVVAPDGTLVPRPDDLRYVIYLLQETEVFARSYTQYIAEKSGDATLLAELQMAQAMPYPEQWTIQDFAPISAEFDGLLAQQGILL